MKLYGLKNCDTCKKALKEIKHARKNIEFVDIRDSYMPLDLIQDLLDRHSDGLLVNRKSITWRNLSHEDRQTPASTLLQAHPTLIKRPIIVVGDHSFVGWNVDVKSALGIV